MPGRTSRPSTVLAVVALCSGVLTACGQTAAQQFRGALSPIEQQALNSRAQISSTLQSVRLHDPASARLLDHQIGALAGAVASMANLRAPTPTAEHALLAYQAAYQALVGALHGVASRVGHGSAAQVRIAAGHATDAAGRVQRASDSLQAALGP